MKHLHWNRLWIGLVSLIWMSCGNRTAQVEELALAAGESWQAAGPYENFCRSGLVVSYRWEGFGL